MIKKISNSILKKEKLPTSIDVTIFLNRNHQIKIKMLEFCFEFRKLSLCWMYFHVWNKKSLIYLFAKVSNKLLVKKINDQLILKNKMKSINSFYDFYFSEKLK